MRSTVDPRASRCSPRPSLAPLPSLILLALAIALPLTTSGCASRTHVVHTSSGESSWVRNGDRWEIRHVDESDRSRLEVTLKIEEETRGGVVHYRLESASLFPPGDPLPRLWRLLSPRSTLRTTDDSVIAHPDRAILDSLPVTLALDAALESCARCIHYDSRGEILLRVAGGPAGKSRFDRLADVIESGEAGPFGAPPPDGLSIPPGGIARRALAPVIARLSARDDLARAEYDRLAGMVGLFPSSRLGTENLERLVGRATVTAIAEATPQLVTTSGRSDVLLRLARLDPLAASEAVAICRATTSIGSSSAQTRVLLALAPDGPVGPILDATSHIASSSGRTEILEMLARRRPLSNDDAIAIARDTKLLGTSDGQTRVLLTLTDVAPVATILDAAQAIGSSSGRTQVLLALAREPDLDATDATRIARATVSLGSSSGQTDVLEELADHATLEALLEAGLAIASTDGRTATLSALTRRPKLSTADADRIAAATVRLGTSQGQTHVLEDLIGIASTRAILTAAASIPSVSARAALLGRIASDASLDAGDAQELARVTPTLVTNSSPASAILRRLVGRAPTATIVASCAQIPSNSERARVLSALARLPDLPTSDAERIARGSHHLTTSDSISDLLGLLIGRASIESLITASTRIPAADTRGELLQRLAAAPVLSSTDADRIAAAAGETGAASRTTARVLRALVDRASVATLVSSAQRIASTDSRGSVLLALAHRKELSRDDATRIAAASGSLGQSDAIVVVLEALLDDAPHSALRTAAARIPSVKTRTRFLERLAARQERVPAGTP